MRLHALIHTVLLHHKKEGRTHLPWRRNNDPYHVLVSELMLQQTQVDRVISKYRAFIKQFPTLQTLAQAPLPSVLVAWQGLGYNRRGKFLHDAVRMIVKKYDGKIPHDPVLIQKLPGVGPYTARAIAAFAFNRPEVFVETNIRTVFIHHYFSHQEKVSDKELLPYIARSLSAAKQAGLSPRLWYGALMDYGAYLKKKGLRINYKSVHYTKQSKFKGSARQLRGVILRILLQAPTTLAVLSQTTARSKKEITHELLRLRGEGLVVSRGSFFSISD